MPEQLELFTVPNPCRGVCEADARGYCRGVFSQPQRAFLLGGQMSDAQKQDVLRLCRQREKRMLRTEKATLNSEWDQPSLFDDD